MDCDKSSRCLALDRDGESEEKIKLTRKIFKKYARGVCGLLRWGRQDTANQKFTDEVMEHRNKLQVSNIMKKLVAAWEEHVEREERVRGSAAASPRRR